MYNLDNSYPTSLNLAIRIPPKNTDSVARQFEKIKLNTFRNFATKKEKKRYICYYLFIYLASPHLITVCPFLIGNPGPHRRNWALSLQLVEWRIVNHTVNSGYYEVNSFPAVRSGVKSIETVETVLLLFAIAGVQTPFLARSQACLLQKQEEKHKKRAWRRGETCSWRFWCLMRQRFRCLSWQQL